MSNPISNIVVVYPGRFQPFALHHKKVADYITEKLDGVMNDFVIATTDKVVDGLSPLSFGEKMEVINASGYDTVVKVASPYNCWRELRAIYDSATTAVIYLVSEKDEERIESMTSTRYYNEVKMSDLALRQSALDVLDKGFEENVYILKVPEFKVETESGMELSGTNIRTYMGQYEYLGIQDDKREKVFKSMFGYFNQNIEDLLVLKFSDFNLNESKHVVTEGGARGHIQHLFEDNDLSFSEIENVIDKSLQGNLSFDSIKPTEKVDGMNCMMTYKDKQCKMARNKSQIANPIDAKELVKFMTNPPKNVVNAYVKCIDQFNSIFSKLNDTMLQDIFGLNSEKFINFEIIDDEASIEMKYDGKFIIFHNVMEYDLNTSAPIKTYSSVAPQLVSIFNKVNDSAKSYFTIKAPIELDISPVKDFNAESNKFKNKLKSIMNKSQLSYEDTVGDLKCRAYEEILEQELTDLNFTFTLENDALMNRLVKRLALNDKKILPITAIEDPQLKDWLKSFESNKKYSKDREVIAELESLVYEIGLTVIQNCINLLSVNKDVTVKHIKDKFDNALVQLSKETSVDGMDNAIIRINKYLEILKNYDESIFQPTEGVVFYMNGKQYKLTGFFGPIHTIASYYQFVK